MLHYFIINPVAGEYNSEDDIARELSKIFKNRNDEYEIYCTQSPNDATLQIKKVCQLRDRGIMKNQHIRFYSAGGDGTSFECINGIIGCENVSIAILPVGSCNDFLKTFPDDDFHNLENMVNGYTKPIDVLKINDRYAVNVCNIGYDAKVNYDCVRTRYRYKTVKQAYNHALAINLLKPLGDRVKVYNQDNELVFDGKSLLLSLGNGQYYGGGFKCTPLAEVDDGLIEISIIKKVSIPTFLFLVSGYKRGEHITNYKKYHKYCIYQRASKVTIVSDKELAVCLDGENFFMKEICVELLPKHINFVFPRKY